MIIEPSRRTRRRLVRAAAVSSVLAVVGCAASSAADAGRIDAPAAVVASAPAAFPNAQVAQRAIQRVGALFYSDIHGDHYCTASVVDSPTKNLLVTAAHCIHDGDGGDYRSGIVFVPGYRNGSAPYGVWKPKTLLVDDQWATSADPGHDVGFVTLAPLDGKNVADVLGANTLTVNQGFDNVVRVTGYPDSADEPITCVNKATEVTSDQMRFDCGGYENGTSGSPWVANFDRTTHTGQVVGVIGGYEGGGDDPDVSYSVYFDDDVKTLYDAAVQRS